MHLKNPYVDTPLIPSLYLSELAGAQVLLKLEMVQPSGSFKSRGLGHLVQHTVANAPPGTRFHFFSPSGGNAGAATAYAARQYGQKCTVCLPKSVNKTMVDRIRKTGANVVVHGDFIADSDRHIKEVLIPECEETAVYCHPYNDPLVWEGNATIAAELVNQFTGPAGRDDDSDTSSLDESGHSCPPPPARPDAVICSVGGGGLYNGLCQGFEKAGWSDVPIVAVETEGCAALHASIAAGGSQVQLAAPRTIATSLATVNVTHQTLAYATSKSRGPTHSVVVSDADAAGACISFARDHKLLIEAACGTALAPIYNGTLKDILPDLTPTSTLVVVICGGTAVTWDILESYSRQFGIPL